MLFDFDLSSINSPDFKEDSVREEIIAPIVKKLGYKPSGINKVIRSKNLVHPFVKIGSKTHKINIVPDYTIEIENQPVAIIEAKSPTEEILMSEHVEQAFSYAIHPEIRSKTYALCNGKSLIVYRVDRWEPILNLNIENIESHWKKVEKTLGPEYLIIPELRDFAPDYGLTFLKSGLNKEIIQIFHKHFIQGIMMYELGKFTASTTTMLGEIECLVSLDLNENLLYDIFSKLPLEIANSYRESIKHAPYNVNTSGKLVLSFSGYLGDVVQGAYEEFAPIQVNEIIDAEFDSSVELEYKDWFNENSKPEE